MRWPAGLLPLLWAAAIPWTQMRVDASLGAFRAQEEALYVWQGRSVKKMAAGFEGLAADIYWLRTVQYFGGQRLFAKDKNFSLLYPLIEITTTLDPHLEIAYRYGAIFLAEPVPIGAGRAREGIAILERGADANPKSWRLRQDLGFFCYLYLKDAERASRTLMQASAIPGAPFWLKTLAVDVLVKGGDRATARQMWGQIYEQAEDGILKAHAQDRLRVLGALDRAEALAAAVEEFTKSVGRRPHDLPELSASGLARAPIVDPTGVPYDYDPATGKVTVSFQSSMWRPQ